MSLAPIATWVTALFLASTLFAHNVALRMVLLFCGALLVMAALVRERASIRLLPPIWIPFLLWGAWAALSITWSIEPARSIKEFHNEIGYSALALWICFVAAQPRSSLRIFLSVATAAAILACSLAIYAFLLEPQNYPDGWHGGPWGHSSMLLTAMPCALMAAWYAHRARWPGWLFSLPLALVILFFASAYTTFNRTIWIGFAVQFALLAGLIVLRARVMTRAPFSWRSRALATVLTLAAISASIGILFTVQSKREATGETAFEQDSRFALWREVGTRIAERPLTGYGFGRGLLRDSLSQALAAVQPYLWHSHNLFLEAMLQLGIPGLALLLFLLGAIVREGWRSARNPNDLVAASGMALIAVVAGMVVRNMTDFLWIRQNALLYWGLVGVLLAWSRSRVLGDPLP